MKANELSAKNLMIGDWVYNTHNSNPEQVCEVWERMVMLDYNDLYDYNEIEPIPLTPEILEKNGFVYDSKDKLFEDIYPRISMLYAQYRLVENGYINYGEMSEIKYVHQLQHALRLCGIEKEIEL